MIGAIKCISYGWVCKLESVCSGKLICSHPFVAAWPMFLLVLVYVLCVFTCVGLGPGGMCILFTIAPP